MSRMIDPNMFPNIDDEDEMNDGMTEIDLKDGHPVKEEKEVDK